MQAAGAREITVAERRITKAAEETPGAPTTKDGSPVPGPVVAPKRDDSVGSSVETVSNAAPLEAPPSRDPAVVMPSSNDPVAANAALMTPSGSAHVRLLGDDGDDIDPESIFEFPSGESPSTLAKVKTRIYQEFRYPGASTKTTQLMYPEGAMVPVQEAMRVREELRSKAQGEGQ
jgi:hypothetical protein